MVVHFIRLRVPFGTEPLRVDFISFSMAPKGKRRPDKAERFEQNKEDTVENDNDESSNEDDEKGEEEFTLDDVLRLGGTKVQLSVSAAAAAPLCPHVEAGKGRSCSWSPNNYL